MVEIFECDYRDAKEWNEFVFNHTKSTYVHRFEQKYIIEQTYGNKTIFLCARHSDGIVGIFPLVLIPGLKRSCISVAYNSYAGILALDNIISGSLLRKLFLEYIKKKYPYCKIIEERILEWCLSKKLLSNEVTMIIDFSRYKTIDEVFRSIRGKKRNQIRKGQKQNFKISWDITNLDKLYEIYAFNMGKKGTPVHPKKFYKNILRHYNKDCSVLTAVHEGKVVGGLIAIKHNKIFTVLMASTIPDYNKLCVNEFLYWEAISYAFKNNFLFFDFGRSEVGSGTYKFKKQWATKEYKLNYIRYTQDGIFLSSTSSTLYRGTYGKVFSNIWKQIPFSIQLLIGPYVRRWIP